MSALLAASYSPPFSNAFAEGLRADRRLGICEWAEKEIRLVDGPEQGRLRLDRTPYLRGVLEAFTDATNHDISLKWAAQLAKTTGLILCAAYVIDQDPANLIWAMPTEDLAKEISKVRIQPIFEKSGAIKRQMTGFASDIENVRLQFLRMTMFFAWAKSPASLSSRPARYGIADECNKFPVFSGKEADPLELLYERTKNFWNAKRLAASTPTTPEGPISTRYAKSDQRRYHVPCPKCGHKQILISQFLKWPKGTDADTIEAQDLAWYECRACGAQLRDNDKHGMLANGEWIADNPKAVGHAGFHLNTLYSPFVRWSTYAKKFLISKDKPELLMNFTNSWEGEDWVEKAAPVSEEGIRSLRVQCAMGVVPSWVLMITFGADVQNDLVKYVVRGWGTGRRSRLLDYGMFPRTKDDNGLWRVNEKTGLDDDLQRIESEILPTQYKRENGETMGIFRAYIDRGYRTDAVDKLCGRNSHVLFGAKGANEVQYEGEGGALVHEREMKPDRKRKFHHYRLNTTHFKDVLQDLRMKSGKIWEIPDSVDETYLREVSAEHKRIDRDGKGRGVHVWTLREGYRDNHYFDCEVYALAAAMHKKQLDRLVEPAAQPGIAPQQKPDGGGWYSGW